MPQVRLAHFSDVHLTARPLGWHPRDWFSKRVSGWVNVRLLGRGKRFRDAPKVVTALIHGLIERRPDAVVFSGDATKMGFESELTVAAAALRVSDPLMPPGIAVPGNHDYYTKLAIRHGHFERLFRPWLAGERIDEFEYPFARKVGHVWLIAVNSCTVNRSPIDASGAVDPKQLARLRQLCDRLDAGPRVLVTHYPLRTHDGMVEPRVHQLRDHVAALSTARECGVHLWLHGHIHKPFVLKPSSMIPFPVICAGSATQNNRWSYFEYSINDWRLHGLRRVYDPALGTFRDDDTFELELR